MQTREVVVIGAGPSGAIASALLKRQGHDVLVLERQHFPRFSIGESLLTHCLDFVEEAGMLPAVEAAGFQFKNGAAFSWGERYTDFDFGDKFGHGRDSTFQVQRASFDKLLADQAALQGVEIRYGESVVAADFSGAQAALRVQREDGSEYAVSAQFVLDGSGYGRVLPRLLDLDTPSAFPSRCAVFTHIEDRIDDPAFDRNKILITIHPEHRGVWYWLIPFSNGRCSLGVVAEESFYQDQPAELQACLQKLASEPPMLARLLKNAVWDTPVNRQAGYSANVKALHGRNFALLGNAAEFLDPVFSSGVTIAMHSASLAAGLVHRQLGGEPIDWDSAFSAPLMRGVNTFRAYVEGWYDGSFQNVIFQSERNNEVKKMICAILAGYAWNTDNPFVAEAKRRLRVVSELCALS